jgi:hypothetical protein
LANLWFGTDPFRRPGFDVGDLRATSVVKSVDGSPVLSRGKSSSQGIGVCRAEGEGSDFVASDVSVTQTQEDQRQVPPRSNGPRDP